MLPSEHLRAVGADFGHPGLDVESSIGAQGPRPPRWRFLRRRAWDRQSALRPDSAVTTLDIDGNAHFALPAPRFQGQRRRITCVAVGRDAHGTVQVATCGGFEFNRVGQSIDLVAVAGPSWRLIGARRVGGV